MRYRQNESPDALGSLLFRTSAFPLEKPNVLVLLIDEQRYPPDKDETSLPVPGTALGQETCWVTRVKTRPEPEAYELYCLTNDPLEVCNLASPAHATEYTRRVQAQMMELLNEQRKRKRLVPG